MDRQQIQNIVEAALLAAGRPLSLDQLLQLFEGEGGGPGREALRAALDALEGACEGRSMELVQVASGYRLQVRERYAPWVGRLWEEKPARYSRALLETLALIVYRQPITRAEIEEIRGVAVSTHIVKTLLEREWVRVLGHKEVPGRPALYGSTRRFLDDFNLSSLDELPSLMALRDLEACEAALQAAEAGPDRAVEPAAGTGSAEASAGEAVADQPATALHLPVAPEETRH